MDIEIDPVKISVDSQLDAVIAGLPPVEPGYGFNQALMDTALELELASVANEVNARADGRYAGAYIGDEVVAYGVRRHVPKNTNLLWTRFFEATDPNRSKLPLHRRHNMPSTITTPQYITLQNIVDMPGIEYYGPAPGSPEYIAVEIDADVYFKFPRKTFEGADGGRKYYAAVGQDGELYSAIISRTPEDFDNPYPFVLTDERIGLLSTADGFFAMTGTTLSTAITSRGSQATGISKLDVKIPPHKIPMPRRQWKQFSQDLLQYSESRGLGDDIFIHGSRATGNHNVLSDIDIAIRVSPQRFDEIINSPEYVRRSMYAPNPGSANSRTREMALSQGRIHAGEARLSSFAKELKVNYGYNIDISIVRAGGNFDNGPRVYLGGK